MIDALELRNQLASLLAGQIGIYKIDGVESPAIAIMPDPDLGWNYPPAGTEVSGIEVVITCPINDYTPLMGGGMAPSTWEVRVKQQEQNGSLHTVVNVLVPALADLLNCARMGRPVQIPPNAAKGIVEQVLIRFTEYVSL